VTSSPAPRRSQSCIAILGRANRLQLEQDEDLLGLGQKLGVERSWLDFARWYGWLSQYLTLPAAFGSSGGCGVDVGAKVGTSAQVLFKRKVIP
jgi:hypothetical protein